LAQKYHGFEKQYQQQEEQTTKKRKIPKKEAYQSLVRWSHTIPDHQPVASSSVINLGPD
jgi:hypothetical protein